MNDLRLIDPLDADLRALDAADRVIDPAARARSAARLDAVIAAEPGLRPFRVNARWLVPAAAAAMVGALILPGMFTPTPAYASWTPTPTPLPEPAARAASRACLDSLAASAAKGSAPSHAKPDLRLETVRTVVAEQRGEFVFVALATGSGVEYSCLAPAAHPDRVSSAGGGIPTMASPEPAPLTPQQLTSGGAGLAGSPSGGFGYSQGRVGADVRRVTIHADGQRVEASVNDGHFAAWWPTKAATAEPMPDPIVTFDVTLADGRVLTDVDTGRPRRATPGPREVGQIVQGGGVQGSRFFHTIAGRSGVEVMSVVVHLDGREVPAEVKRGSFTASWDIETPVNPSVVPDPVEPTFTLTLRDGTVLRGVRAVR